MKTVKIAKPFVFSIDDLLYFDATNDKLFLKNCELVSEEYEANEVLNELIKLTNSTEWIWNWKNVIINFLHVDMFERNCIKEENRYELILDCKKDRHTLNIVEVTNFHSKEFDTSLFAAYEAAIAERKRLNDIAGRI